jgi:hypothetical protein
MWLYPCKSHDNYCEDHNEDYNDRGSDTDSIP